MHAGIASLKILGQYLDFNPQSCKVSQTLSHLTHLDLEYCVYEYEASLLRRPPHWSIWTEELNKYLCTLINLRGLRLSSHPGFHPREDTNPLYAPSYMFGSISAADQYYFDAALSNCVWPHLRSLALARWPMRQAGLENIINSHTKTLRGLELDGMSLLREKNFTDNKTAWLLIAQGCTSCQDLRYLKITKPRAHYWFLEDHRESEKFDEPGFNGGINRTMCICGILCQEVDDMYRAAGHPAPERSEIDYLSFG